MKATELRIGNYLALPTRGESGELVIVEELLENNFIVCDITTNEWPVSDYKPIPLTEEWLLKFGFEKGIKNGIYIHPFSNVTQGIFKGEGEWEVVLLGSIPCHFNKRIQFVHELQNLYFALTGEELVLL